MKKICILIGLNWEKVVSMQIAETGKWHTENDAFFEKCHQKMANQNYKFYSFDSSGVC